MGEIRTTGQDCVICGRFVDGDDAFLQHHTNLCLDGVSPRDDDSTHPSTSRAFDVPAAIVEGTPIREALPDEQGGAQEGEGLEGCPICGGGWEPGVDRDAHVAACLGDFEAPIVDESASQEPGMLGDFLRPFSNRGSPDAEDRYGGIYTENLLPQFGPLLDRACHASTTRVRSAVLCSPNVVHCRAKVFFGPGSDTGWGCGYRNAQMLLSAARWEPAYRDMLLARDRKQSAAAQLPAGEVASILGIPEMQTIIEDAWNQGFDPTGAEHFGGRLLNKRKWIGTTEIYVLLTSLGLRANIVDFPKTPGSQGAHNGLTQWVKKYFELNDDQAARPSTASMNGKRSAQDLLLSSGGTPVRRTNKLPLYLQHQGHSRTIVGIEERANGETWLLVFDPAKSVALPLKKAAASRPPASPEHPSSSPLSPDSTAATDRPSPEKKLRGGFGVHIPSKLKKPADGGGPAPSKAGATIDPKDHAKLLEPYRVSLRNLGRRDQYQILYVDADGPALTLAEQLERREIQAVVVQ